MREEPWGEMVEMRVENLTAYPTTARETVWLRVIEGKVMVPIEIGHTEYLAIYAALVGEELPRPLTHDLLKTILDHFDTQVEEVQIVDLKDSIYYAELVLSRGGEQLRLDARSSDSIALALKYDAPIFMDGSIIEQAGHPFRVKDDKGLELEALDPSELVRASVFEAEEAQEAFIADNPEGQFDFSILEGLSQREKIDRLKEQMEKAARDEQYEMAGRIRDEITRLESQVKRV
ncbi:MAG: DUF151 domain-containing protein [bacterium]|nr:DUF151 domain-containing protein [bacterium]